MELVDAYARVIAMIEIEVEMETQVPEAEVLGEHPRERVILEASLLFLCKAA